MLRGRVASLPQGYAPLDSTPRPRGVLPQALRACSRGRSPGAPCSSWYGVTKNPQPLSSTTYLRGEEVCLATRLGQKTSLKRTRRSSAVSLRS